MAAAGIISTGSHPKLLWPGVRATWGQTYAEHAEEFSDLYEIENTDRAYEEDVQITPFSLAPIKPEGDPLTYQGEVQGPVTRYTPIVYATGFIVTMEELMNNLYKEVATRRAKANAFALRQTVENVAAFIYNNAFASTYFTTADGVSLINTAHVNTTGGTYSNALSPAADLSEASLEDLTVQIMGVQDDQGNMINIMPRSLHIARQEWYNANRILKSVLQSNTANNNINVLKATNAFPEGIKMNHYFTAPHAWFIRTNCMNGMTFLWRYQTGLEQDNDFDTKNAKASAMKWFAVGCTDPRGIFASNGP